MKIIKVDLIDKIKVDDSAYVKVVETGNIVKIQYMSRQNNKATIKMLPGGNQFVELSTGEIKDVVHHDLRVDMQKNLKRTFELIRDLINCNVVKPKNVLWITLTYQENITDSKQVYNDFKNMQRRFKAYCMSNNIDIPEYINILEPQGRGAWQCHLLYIWEHVAPFIDNKLIWSFWSPKGYKQYLKDSKGYDYTKIKKLNTVDNVGAYLTAYLADMEVSEYKNLGYKLPSDTEIKEVIEDINEVKKKKYFIKGGRLPFYPANFNIVRTSKGIKRPVSYDTTNAEAIKKVSTGQLTFEKNVAITDTETDFSSVLNVKYYNLIRNKKQS